MKPRNLGFGALAGGLLVAPMIAVMYLVDKWVNLSFPPFDVFDWIARILPGPVVTFGIDLMIDVLGVIGMSVADTAKTAEQVIAILMFLAGGVVATIVVFALVERWERLRAWPKLGYLIGAVVGVPIALITANIAQSTVNPSMIFVWTLLLFLTWGATSVRVALRLLISTQPAAALEGGPEEEVSVQVLGRRQFLIRMGVATATITVAGSGIGRMLSVTESRARESELEAMEAKVPGSGPMIELPNEGDPVKPALGTRPEYTAVRDHYQVFIRSEPTMIDGDTWELPITGLVDNPMTMNLDYIMSNYEPRSEFITLTCISNRIGGDLISTTYWTGASLQEILADVEPTSEARYLFISSGDGFYETVDLNFVAEDERIMLAYAWDGRPIPFDHGFPLRIWLPDRYGMKQPKWITSIEVIGEYKPGYWVERNWDEVARIRTTSVIDTIAVDAAITEGDDKLVPIGGIAFAGVRGISKVEIQVDGEGPWHEAQLRKPLSEATWVIWRYDWPFSEGSHRFEVRTVEADGTAQLEERNPPRPSGATGLHDKSARL